MAYFIMEQPIFQEANVVHSTPGKARFRMVMQTMDEINQNKRLYPKPTLTEAMNDCKSRIKSRAFLGEMDHPIPTGSRFDEVRQTTVLLKDASHVLVDYDVQGNRIIGELETLSQGNGSKLLGLIRDKVGLGLSMRGMAELENRKDGINVVKKPLMVITYDSVSMPSHKEAVIDYGNVKMESFIYEMNFQSMDNIITESNCGIVCTPDGRCYLPEYFDKLVETKTFEFFKMWV